MNVLANNSMETFIQTKSLLNLSTLDDKSSKEADNNYLAQKVTNVDTYEDINAISNFEEMGIYKKSMKNNSPVLEEASAIRTLSSNLSTSKHYNVIVARAAKNSGVALTDSGEPKINGGYDAKNYNDALKRITSTFWCQTGGWSNLAGNGSKECGRTASATMASINSDSIVTPNDTGSKMKSITVDRKTYTADGNHLLDGYSFKDGAADGYNTYKFSSSPKLISAINNELSNGRSAVVYVTSNSGSEHWVTITGTKNNKAASSFSDFNCVDPWYNGNNTEHGGSTGVGNYATNSAKSGIISISSSCKDFRLMDGEFTMVTFRKD